MRSLHKALCFIFCWMFALFASADARLLSVASSCADLRQLVLTFDKDLEPSSITRRGNYIIRSSAGRRTGVRSATLTAPREVTLRLSRNPEQRDLYTVRVVRILALGSSAPWVASTQTFRQDCVNDCYTADFSSTGALGADWTTSSSAGPFGAPRVIDSGRLRFTSAQRNNATLATLLRQIPSANNFVSIEFTHYAYGGNGADGIAVVLSDSLQGPSAGGFGGSLGYAQRSGIDGFAGGWLGVGLDEYGNFSNQTEGREGGVGRQREAVTLRGSGSQQTGYPFLFTTNSLSPGIDAGGNTPAPAHRYRISIDNASGGRRNALVMVERDTGAGYQVIVPKFRVRDVNPSQVNIPANVFLSFTGSTGGRTNIHEIGDLEVCTIRPSVPVVLPTYYRIQHGNTAFTCEEERIRITAYDASDQPVNVTRDTFLNFSASTSFDSIRPARIRIRRGRSAANVFVTKLTAESNIDIDVTDGFVSDVDGDAALDPPLSFVESGFRFFLDGNALGPGDLPQQIAGKFSDEGPDATSGLTLAGIRLDQNTRACERYLRGARDVDFAFTCLDPSNCAGTNQLQIRGEGSASIDGSDFGATLSYDSVPLRFNNQGVAPIRFLYEDAGRIELHARQVIPGLRGAPDRILEGQSPAFVVRPFALHMDIQTQRDQDLADNGVLDESFNSDPINVASSVAVNAGGSKFIAAGETFSADVRAVVWQAGDDLDQNGLPDDTARLLDNALTPNFGQESNAQTHNIVASRVAPTEPNSVDGNLVATNFQVGGSASTFNGGDSRIDLSYAEVGIIDTQLSLGTYLGESAARVSGELKKVGRFTPSYFDLAFTNGAFAPACGTFTYLGQPFDYEVTDLPSVLATARNAQGDVVQNYSANDFMRLTAASFARGLPNTDASALDRTGAALGLTYSSDSLFPQGRIFSTVGSGVNEVSAGSVRYAFGPQDSLEYDKDSESAIVPFDTDVQIQLTSFADTDGISVLPGATLGIWTPASTPIRYGRWVTTSASGAFSQPLSVPGFTEYLASSGDYRLNTDDNCTATSGALQVRDTDGALAVDLGNIKVDTSSTALTTAFQDGDANIAFSAPGVEGSVQLESDLSNLPWLRHSWQAGTVSDPPDAMVRFGQFRGHDRVIFWRENGAGP